MNTQLNIDMIRAAVTEMPIGMDLMNLYRGRQRGRQDSSFRRIMRLLSEKGKRYKMAELQAFMKIMQDAGAGQIVFSKNKPPRFVFDFHLQSLAKAALTKAKAPQVKKASVAKVVLPKVEELGAASAVSEKTQAPGLAPNEVNTMTVKRNGFEITLPLDLTPEQARIAQVLLSGLDA